MHGALDGDLAVLVVDGTGAIVNANKVAEAAGDTSGTLERWAAEAGLEGELLQAGPHLVARKAGPIWVTGHPLAHGAWVVTAAVLGRDPSVAGDNEELAEALIDVAGVIGADGTVRWVNRAVKMRLGWEPADVAGRSALDLVHPSDRPAAQQALTRAGAERRREDVQLRLAHADGSFHPAAVSLLPRNTEGQQAGLMFLAREPGGEQAQLEYFAHLAQHDPLTGLANRILLQDRLAQGLARARRSGHPLVVAVIDLDGFKAINDEYGHAIGDVVLVEAARRLVRLVRPADTVARLGGDEFVVVAEGLSLAIEAAGFGDRLIEGLRPPIAVPGKRTVVLGASVGVAAGVNQTPNQLVAEADFALLDAKRGGRGRTVLSWERPDAADGTRK